MLTFGKLRRFKNSKTEIGLYKKILKENQLRIKATVGMEWAQHSHLILILGFTLNSFPPAKWWAVCFEKQLKGTT